MRLIDADALESKVLEWMPPDPCGREEKEYPFETDIVASLMMEIEEAPTIKQPTWTPCSERLPEACQNVQLTCEVRPVGREPSRYVCIAQWIPRFCQEALSVNWDAETTEYCEEDDEYYPLEGWYERIRNWDDYSLVGIADFAIAWKPLEEPYKGVEE